MSSSNPTPGSGSSKPSTKSKNTTNKTKQQSPLFKTVENKHGKKKMLIETNDTTEMLKPIPTETVETELDTVLDAVKQVDTTCDYSRCKTKTSLMRLDCKHCSKQFCFKHGLPEVHGCGEAIKRVERTEFLHPKPQKTLQREEDLKKARSTMQQKLKDMNLARKAKPPKQKDAKK